LITNTYAPFITDVEKNSLIIVTSEKHGQKQEDLDTVYEFVKYLQSNETTAQDLQVGEISFDKNEVHLQIPGVPGVMFSPKSFKDREPAGFMGEYTLEELTKWHDKTLRKGPPIQTPFGPMDPDSMGGDEEGEEANLVDEAIEELNGDEEVVNQIDGDLWRNYCIFFSEL